MRVVKQEQEVEVELAQKAAPKVALDLVAMLAVAPVEMLVEMVGLMVAQALVEANKLNSKRQ